VLGFVGTKMLLAELYPIPIGASLGVVAALLAGSIVASVVKGRLAARRAVSGAGEPAL
jgi:tellurite resistance protein TerC